MVYPHKTPKVVQRLFPDIVWRCKAGQKKLYLSFDDGPTPTITNWVLDCLDHFHASATFFCIGRKVNLHQELYQSILYRGHAVGNHSYSHFNGWTTSSKNYVRDVLNARDQIQSKLFRPPYGRLRPGQYKELSKHFQIICWDVLSGDFDPKLDKLDCWGAVKTLTEDGSIIVFHDILKSKEKLQEVLPKVLSYFGARGYSFERINFECSTLI